jgi:hypothetical protein
MDTRTAYRAAYIKCHGVAPNFELSPEDEAVLETLVEFMSRRKPWPRWVRETLYWLLGLVVTLGMVKLLLMVGSGS